MRTSTKVFASDKSLTIDVINIFKDPTKDKLDIIFQDSDKGVVLLSMASETAKSLIDKIAEKINS